jgi:SPP1 gp7 family putative phage head morphogenesis protein
MARYYNPRWIDKDTYSNGWEDRLADAKNRRANKSVNEINKQLTKYYKTAVNRVIKDFEATYDKLLATVENGKEPTPADLYKLNKYWEMQGQLKNELQKLGDKEIELLSKQFTDTFKADYEAITLGANITPNEQYNKISTEAAKEMINSVWVADGKSWSERIWDNTSKLAETLNEELIHCVVTGKKTSQLKSLLQERFNASYAEADRLARTEIAHIQTEAAKKRYEDYGLQYVEIWADKDERRCEVCGKLHKKRYPIGATVPIPAHPNCRCSIIPVVEDEPKPAPQRTTTQTTAPQQETKKATAEPVPTAVQKAEALEVEKLKAIKEAGELTQDEKDAIEYYVSGDGMYINDYLRDRNNPIERMGAMGEMEKALIKELDKATDKEIAAKTLYRSVDATAVFGDMSAMEFENLQSALIYGIDDKFTKQAKEKFLQSAKGKQITDNGFMSTTKSAEVAFEFGGFTGSDKPIVIEFMDCENARGCELAKYMPELEDRMEQEEILIKRKQKYRIEKIGSKNGSIWVLARFL